MVCEVFPIRKNLIRKKLTDPYGIREGNICICICIHHNDHKSIVSLCLAKQSWCDHTSFGQDQPPSLPRLYHWSPVTLKTSREIIIRRRHLASFVLDSKAGSACNDSAFVGCSVMSVVSNRHRDWHHPTLEVLGFLRADLGKPIYKNPIKKI